MPRQKRARTAAAEEQPQDEDPTVPPTLGPNDPVFWEVEQAFEVDRERLVHGPGVGDSYSEEYRKRVIHRHGLVDSEPTDEHRDALLARTSFVAATVPGFSKMRWVFFCQARPMMVPRGVLT